jgi:lipopolysaccharide export system permease protein
MRTLDRYVIRQFLRIFLIAVLGVPFLFIVINLTDSLDNFIRDGVGRTDVALHYIYQFPYNMLLAFPVASLLAAVFTVSSMTRHSEMTAAKAAGLSFHRIVAPMVILAMGISLVALALTEVIPHSNRLAGQALGEGRQTGARLTFVFRGQGGRFYSIQRLTAGGANAQIEQIRIDREGTGFSYPAYSVDAPQARWDSIDGRWIMTDGSLRFFPQKEQTLEFRFNELHQAGFRESPSDLLAEPKSEDEMGLGELRDYIEALDRSGSKTGRLRVQLMMRFSFPFVCLIIVLFGAPLATTTARGGASMSIGLALVTMILLLGMLRLAEAMGAAGIVPPPVAPWIPNFLFLGAGLYLMKRVRT